MGHGKALGNTLRREKIGCLRLGIVQQARNQGTSMNYGS